MMDAVRQWAFSLCAAAMACAVIELLLPSISLAKMTRLALSVFFLCVLIQPLGLEAHGAKSSLKPGREWSRQRNTPLKFPSGLGGPVRFGTQCGGGGTGFDRAIPGGI